MPLPSRHVTFVAPVPFLAKRTRLLKFAECYLQQGFGISHIGWEREPGEDSTLDRDPAEVSHSIVLRGGGYGGGTALAKFYIRWLIAVARELRQENDVVIHALGLESALPALLVKILFRKKFVVIYDDADRMSLCHPFPKAFRTALQFIERWVGRRADLHVAPSRYRYADGVSEQNFVELKNSPSAAAIAQADSEPVVRPADAKLVLYINGWIGAERGADLALELADDFADDKRFHILAAGRTTGPAAEKLIARPNVTYLGEITNHEALAYYRVADLVLTMYDPARIINQYAEPNKWGDCVRSKTPFLVNQEVETARPFIEAGIAFPIRFGDAGAAARLVESVLQGGFRLNTGFERPTGSIPSYADFDHVVRQNIIPAIGVPIVKSQED